MIFREERKMCGDFSHVNHGKFLSHLIIIIIIISNGNRTEWSTIQGVIGRLISNRPSA